MKKKHILVTGGAGYIGSHAAWRLQEEGFTPVVVDNLSNGHLWAVKFGPLAKGDIGDAAFIRGVCAEYNPEALMHFAAFMDVAESVKNPEKYHDNNVLKAKVLFATARNCGIKHVVFSSTAAVYGTPRPDGLKHDGLITEETPLEPVNPYGESKRDAEQFLSTLQESGVNSFALRYFNAAGAAPAAVGIGEAHWPETHLIPRVLLAARGHEPFVNIFGEDYPTPDGTALRDYVHVTDLVRAHISALQYLQGGGGSEVCNLGTGAGYSVKQVIDAVEACLGRAVPRRAGPRRAGDPPRLVADIGKARRILGWQPEYGLPEIIASAAAWHDSPQYREAVIGPRYGL